MSHEGTFLKIKDKTRPCVGSAYLSLSRVQPYSTAELTVGFSFSGIGPWWNFSLSHQQSIGKGRYFLFPISTTICLFAVPIFFLSVLWNRRKSVFISSVVVSHQVLKGVKLIELLFRKIYIYVPDFSTFRLGVNRVHMLITYHAYVM